MDKHLIPAIFCALMFVMCNIGTKKSLEPGYGWIMYLVYVTAILAFWSFQKLCRNYGLAVTSGVVDSLLTVATVFAGLVFFGEVLSFKQYMGLGLLLMGLYLVR